MALGVAGPPPRVAVWPWGWLQPQATPNRPNKFFLKKFDFWPLGVADPPPRALGWRHPPPFDRSRVAPWPLEVDRPPPMAKSIFLKKFVWPLGVAEPPQGPPFGRGMASATLDRPAWGGRSHPHGQTVALGGGLAIPRAI
jgi:hypothetical protein